MPSKKHGEAWSGSPPCAAARSLIARAILWDNQACFPLDRPAALAALEDYAAAGVTIVSVNVGYGASGWDAHLRTLMEMRDWLGSHPRQYRLVRNGRDVRACKSGGQVGIVFDVEGMAPVVADLDRIQLLYDLGVRWMLVAYNRSNAAGGGCLDRDHGLTGIGKAVIREMERVGMLLCLSHTGARTAMEAIDFAKRPPILSHSNPAAIAPHARNVSDDLVRACAAKGGVIGLSGIGPYLGARSNLVDAFHRQLFHLLDLVGPDHVAIGLDHVIDRAELAAHVRERPDMYPPDIDGDLAMLGPDALEAIVEGMLRRGVQQSAIEAVLGGNWLRLAETVWR
jgi:membrane dipeptidase